MSTTTTISTTETQQHPNEQQENMPPSSKLEVISTKKYLTKRESPGDIQHLEGSLSQKRTALVDLTNINNGICSDSSNSIISNKPTCYQTVVHQSFYPSNFNNQNQNFVDVNSFGENLRGIPSTIIENNNNIVNNNNKKPNLISNNILNNLNNFTQIQNNVTICNGNINSMKQSLPQLLHQQQQQQITINPFSSLSSNTQNNNQSGKTLNSNHGFILSPKSLQQSLIGNQLNIPKQQQQQQPPQNNQNQNLTNIQILNNNNTSNNTTNNNITNNNNNQNNNKSPSKTTTITTIPRVKSLTSNDFQTRMNQHLYSSWESIPHRDIDEEFVNDQVYCVEYADEIYDNMRKSQKKTQPLDYMSQQSEIKPSMRSVLVDWIVELGTELRVKNETLFLTINYLDRYLSQTQVTKEQFQLIGASTFLIACKYEEYRAPNPYQIQILAGNYFTVKQLFEVESHILKVLGFNLTTPTIKFFLTRYLRAVSRDSSVCALAHFYGEMALMDYDLMNQYPSIVAAACVYLALKTVNRPWTTTLTYYTRVFVDDPYFQQCVKILWELHRSNNNLYTIKQKYSQLIQNIPTLQILNFN